MVLPSGRMKLSTGFADGCNGGIFSRCIPRSLAKVFIAAELNGGPLSESCVAGLPYAWIELGLPSLLQSKILISLQEIWMPCPELQQRDS